MKLTRVYDFSLLIIKVYFIFCYFNFIVFFQYFIKYYHIMLLSLYFAYLGISCWDFFMAALLLCMLTPILLPSSVSSSYFILAIPTHECSGKHLFSIAYWMVPHFLYPYWMVPSCFFMKWDDQNGWRVRSKKLTIIIIIIIQTQIQILSCILGKLF